MYLCLLYVGVSPQASTVVVMQENPSYTAMEEVVSMEPNPCYSAMPAITDGETICTIYVD